MAIQKAHKACPISKVKANFKMGTKVYEVCAAGKRPVIKRLTDEALARRSAAQQRAAIRKVKQEAEKAGEVLSTWTASRRAAGLAGYRKSRKSRRRSRR